MRPFAYAAPVRLEQALELLADGDATVLAGGTDLLSLMKDDVESPSRLVGLRGIDELRGVERTAEGGVRIGAMTTLEALRAAEALGAYPAIVQALDGIRAPQLRAMGTVGGELLQRPRCWYYRAGFGLLARRDGVSMVPAGDNRYHAVLGHQDRAYFVSPSSLAPALMVFGARVEIAGPDGARSLPLAELFRVPARDGEREHAITAGEILTAVVLPASAGGSATWEVRQRRGLDWPLVTASAAVETAGGVVRQASLVLGHVAPTPWVADAALELLAGKALLPDLAASAAEAAVAAAAPLGGNAYKVRLARVAARRALLLAAGLEVGA